MQRNNIWTLFKPPTYDWWSKICISSQWQASQQKMQVSFKCEIQFFTVIKNLIKKTREIKILDKCARDYVENCFKGETKTVGKVVAVTIL